MIKEELIVQKMYTGAAEVQCDLNQTQREELNHAHNMDHVCISAFRRHSKALLNISLARLETFVKPGSVYRPAIVPSF
jgi:hypothetical protein